MGSLPALLAPLLALAAQGAAEVDPRIHAAFDGAPRQRLIVEVVDEAGEAPLAFLPVKADREKRLAVREAAFGARKDRILRRVRQGHPAAAASVVSRWPSFPLLAVEADAEGARALAADPEVKALHFDRLSRPLATTSFAFTGATAWHAQGQRGRDTAVAVLDSTVRWRNGFFGDCPKPGAPGCSVAVVENFSVDSADSVGEGEAHGTNVAGIVLGMAPETRIVSLNVFHYDETYRGYVSALRDELDALQWLVANAETYQVVSANMSLGADQNLQRPCNGDPLYAAFKTLWDTRGIPVAVASGNEGYENGLGTPACISLAVTVAAQYDVNFENGSCGNHLGHAGDLTCFSDRNGMVDLVAPGVDIDAGGVYGYTGTSMAAPHVAGAMALLQGVRRSRGSPLLPPEQLHRKLLVDAVPRLFGGWPYSQLRVAPDARTLDSLELARWPRDAAVNAIPMGAATPLTVQLDVSGLGLKLAGVYLYLEVIHLKPEDLRVALIAPSGNKVDFQLPRGISNFVGVIGHGWLPGAFADLKGESIDGTWKLEIADVGTTGEGNLLEAALIWPRSPCTPDCRARDCGDDGCGGTCAVCIIEEECLDDGTRQPGDPCHACDAAVDPKVWAPTSGEACDDGDPCTKVDVCSAGACTGTEPVVCTEADQCHVPGLCDSRDGTCGIDRKEEGTPCDDANACTSSDECLYGACRGTPKPCPVVECRSEGACDPGTGACQSGAAVADGTKCSKGQCKAGECKGSCGCSAGSEPAALAWLLGAMLMLKRRNLLK